MKIAVVGCGAVGSFYGAKLSRDGHDVHFLLRSGYETVRRKGVFVRSPLGDFHVRPKCARTAAQVGPSELVLIALKTTANDQFANLLPPLVGPSTAVLTLQNGLGNEEQLARLFPVGQILGGLCFTCLNRVEPGLVQHMAHGQIIIGEFQRWPEPRTHDIAEVFRRAGVPCSVTDNLARAHWEKLTWNIPFNGLGVASAAGYDALTRIFHSRRSRRRQSALISEEENLAPTDVGGYTLRPFPPQCEVSALTAAHFALRPSASLVPCLTTDSLLGDPKWARLVRQLVLEVIAVARALGLDLEDNLADKQIERTRAMGAYKASTLIDFERGQALELEGLFLEPLRQAQKAGVPAPRLEALCTILTQLDRMRAAGS